MNSGDSKFNIGVDRIKWIAQISNQLGRSYHDLIQKPSQKKAKKAINMLDTLLFELRHQIGDEEKAEEIQEDIDKAIEEIQKKESYSHKEMKEIKKKCRSIRKDLGIIMKKEGIDIPRKTELDPENAFTEGNE